MEGPILDALLVAHSSQQAMTSTLLLMNMAHVYSSEAGDCAAFLANYDTKSSVRVMFNNMHYNVPPWSISILPDCRNVFFNTAKVGVQTSQMEMLPSNAELSSWETFNEDTSSLDDSSLLLVSWSR